MIKWGSSSYRPSNGQGQGINPPKRQNILSPLESRTPQGLVWGSQIVNVQKDGSTPEPISPVWNNIDTLWDNNTNLWNN